MKDIEVIGKLEKLLGVESLEIDLKKWHRTTRPSNIIIYAKSKNEIENVYLNSVNLKNHLDTSFNVMTKLNSLVVLELLNSHFEEIPKSIGKLVSLKYLDLSNNKLEKFPEGATQLLHLETLDLQSNKIREIPEIVLVQRKTEFSILKNKLSRYRVINL